MPPYILVIDDYGPLTDILALILEANGYDVVTANDGPAALKQVAMRVPSLVLLDVHMPVMSGWEVLRQLRERGVLVPVLMMSGTVSAEALVPGSGGDGFVTKPFEVHELVQTVRGLMPQAPT